MNNAERLMGMIIQVAHFFFSYSCHLKLICAAKVLVKDKKMLSISIVNIVDIS